MNTEILLDMLFECLEKRRVTARYLAEKYAVSERTVYRYIEELSKKVPIFVKRGRNGGICLSDSYRLPVGFMSGEEYTALLDALQIAYANDPNPRFMTARRKLNAQVKSERRDFTVTGEEGGFFVDEPLLAQHEKIGVLHECMGKEVLAEIEYFQADGKKIFTKIEPHAFLFQKGIWSLYAFCHHRREFQIFSVGRICAVLQTDEPFRKRPFTRQDVPLLSTVKTPIAVQLEIAESSLDRIRDKVGVENLRLLRGKWIAELALSEDSAEETVLSLGVGVKVLSPSALREKVVKMAKNILQNNL